MRKKLVVLTFLWPQISENWKNYFIFDEVQKKIWANWQRNKVLFTQIIVSKLSKIRVGDPVFGIRDSIRDRGSGKNLFWIQGSKGQRILYPGSATLLAPIHHYINSLLSCIFGCPCTHFLELIILMYHFMHYLQYIREPCSGVVVDRWKNSNMVGDTTCQLEINSKKWKGFFFFVLMYSMYYFVPPQRGSIMSRSRQQSRKKQMGKMWTGSYRWKFSKLGLNNKLRNRGEK